MNRSKLKIVASFLIIGLTITVFIVFFVHNKTIRDQLCAVSPLLLTGLVGLYFVFMVSLTLIFRASLTLCRTTIPTKELAIVSGYSSVINFFGPLQSGPAFRALYLKKKHGLKLRDYTLASLIYYGFYAFYSALLLLSGVAGWWLLVGTGCGVLLVIGVLQVRPDLRQRLQRLPIRGFSEMAVASFAQVMILVLIFFIELRAVDSSVTLAQTLVYTGAANFALFVSITPGAIGFRESFLIFSQHLHGISTGVIAAANLLDRGAYIVMLLITVVILFTGQASALIRHIKAST
jgi:uncharacterized membrane protein YbhN (UPF0104 family)